VSRLFVTLEERSELVYAESDYSEDGNYFSPQALGMLVLSAMVVGRAYLKHRRSGDSTILAMATKEETVPASISVILY